MRQLTLLVLLCAAVAMDLKSTRISNRLIVLGLVLGFVFRVFGDGSTGIVLFFLNVSIPVICLYLFFHMHALGAGDIKLFSVVGSFLTTRQLIDTMLAAFCIGAVLGIGKLVYVKATTGSIRGKRNIIHFSVAILIAYVFVVWGCVIGQMGSGSLR